MSKVIEREIRNYLKPRRRDSHKGDYGRIFILAGSRGLTGAAFLATMGALRAGAGLVTVGVPEVIYEPMVKKITEGMPKPLPDTKEGTVSLRALKIILTLLEDQDVLALGPGLSRNRETQQLIRKLVLKSRQPLVLDADALNAFVRRLNLLKGLKREAILTPHPGEFSRLFMVKVPRGEAERKKQALEFAKKFKVVIVLKGYHTVVANSQGQVYVNETGNPGMATGGTGDLLVGMIAAFLGQGLSPFLAAKFACYIHGSAGDLVAKKVGEISLIPTDILDYLPLAFKKILKR